MPCAGSRRRRADALRFPRGLVFHVPPANVDTIFVYSWALSALAGNSNVVRISSRSAGAADADPRGAERGAGRRRPGHRRRPSAWSPTAATTRSPRRSAGLRPAGHLGRRPRRERDPSSTPLAPHARDVTFPDRASFAADLRRRLARRATPDQRAARPSGSTTTRTGSTRPPARRRARCSGSVADAAGASRARTEFRGCWARPWCREGLRRRARDGGGEARHRLRCWPPTATRATIRFDGNAVADAGTGAGRRPCRARWLGAGTFPFGRAADR